MIPPLALVHRFRPVQLVQHERLSGFRAPFVAVEAELDPAAPSTALSLRSGDTLLSAIHDARRRRVRLEVHLPGATQRIRSRRHGRVRAMPVALALTLTGRWLTAWTRDTADGPWTARCKTAVTDVVEVRDPAFLHSLAVVEPQGTAGWRAGTFGQVGLRDLHVVTYADGSAYVRDGRHYVTATQAGPGFADTAQTGVWSWRAGTDDLRPEALLWWRRDGLVHGDHAVHLVRDGEAWRALASTWGDFARTRVAITQVTTATDLLTGEHVLEAEEVDLPRPPGAQKGVWDPHLVCIDGAWHLSWVTARRFFDFRPALARAATPTGPWELVGVIEDRTATEGGVIVETEEGWRLLASDGVDNRRGLRQRYPAFDLELREVGALDAPYGSNIPWPSVVRLHDVPSEWAMLTFDGTEYGGPLPGYGTHGDVLVLRSGSAQSSSVAASSSARTSD
ncbi:hypothetical protein [Nocardioides sp.]|uniref:hypothetical protein n=1 Tax=Nocardioides sp. TaxID=35761 RepID=UPI002CF3A08C|nr:hypothetical protein [Nocardioides sp.]HSX66532.1 hypothetical protein [Nocardioides sp.]